MSILSSKIKYLWMPVLAGMTFLSYISYAGDSITLKECFTAALKQSEVIASSEESIKSAEAKYKQVVGHALPEFSFRFTEFFQDQSGLSASDALSSFTKSPQPEAAFRMKLPIFSGYREIAAIKAGGSLVSQKKYERNHAELQLFMDVARAYHAVTLAKKDLAAEDKILSLAEERAKELKEREAIGRSRKAEMIDIEAKLATLKAQKEDAILTYNTAIDLLEFLTGITIQKPLQEETSSTALKPLEDYLSTASLRPDIKAKEEAIEAAKGIVRTKKAEHLPQLDVSTNYYVERSGFRDAINWDATLGVTVPLWSWGTTHAGVKEAKSSQNLAKLDSALAQRNAELEIKTAYERSLSAGRKFQLQGDALKLLKKSYEIRSDEYRKGLVNNLEVLDALDRLYSAELSFNAARFNNIVSYLELAVKAGNLPEEFK